jgi:hypothetical protein
VTNAAATVVWQETVLKYCLSMNPLFRTFSRMSKRFPVARIAVSKALFWSLPDTTVAAYQRGDLREKRVRLMQAWSDYCSVTLTKLCLTCCFRPRV